MSNKFLDSQGLQTLWGIISEHFNKRNNSYDDSYVPYKGQICFIDSYNNGLKLKIGDGITTFKDLPLSGNKTVACAGYYNETYDCFFMEQTQTNIIPRDSDVIYLNIPTNEVFYFNGTKYNKLISTAQVDSNKNGLIKLYSSHGANIDGTMTQKAITDSIDAITFGLDPNQEECVVLNKPW